MLQTGEIVRTNLKVEEMRAAFFARCAHHIEKIRSEHKRNSLLADPHETLVVSKYVTEINVE